MKKILSSLLFIVGMTLIISLPVLANNEDINNEFDIKVSTEKNSYEADEKVNYMIELTNLSPFEAEDIVLKALISDGLDIIDTEASLENDHLIWNIDRLEGKGTVDISFTAKQTETSMTPPVVKPDVEDQADSVQNSEDQTGNEQDLLPPQTSDNTNIIIYIGILLVSIILLTTALIVYKKKKHSKKAILFLILILIASTSVFTSVNAEGNKLTRNHSVSIDGETYEMTFLVESAQFDLPEFQAEFILPDDFNEEDYYSLEEPALLVNYLSWNEINEAESYTVKKATNGGSYEVLSAGLTDLTLVDAEIEIGQTYRYSIEAIYQEEVVLVTNEITQLAAPVLDVDLNMGMLTLSSEEVYGASEYEVYRGQLELIDDVISYSDYELMSSKNDSSYEEKLEWDENVYYYFIRAVNEESTSYHSNLFQIDTANIDSDNDGLTDQLELEVGSDPDNPDTNNNGIPDGYEYHLLDSDPSDLESQVASLDFDEDGLTNLEEYELGTDPWTVDTDGDGLSDGDEVNTYYTDPLNPDTDGDGLLDGSEILLGFDPLKPDTDGNGILDSEEFTLQEVEEESLDELYTDDNSALPSISIYGQGDINHSISVKNASDYSLLSDLIYIEGYPIDISLNNDFDYANIEFEMDDRANLDEYVIVHYDEGNIYLLDTEVNYDTNTISTTVDHFSIYFAAHLPTLEHSWGITGDVDEDLSTPIVERGAADISFVIDTTGSMGGTINNVKNNIIHFVENMNEQDVDVRLGLIDYKDITSDGIDSTKNLGWSTDPVGFQSNISSLRARGGGDRPESAVDALEEARQMGYRENVNKYMILVTDADYKEETRFDDVNSMEDAIDKLTKDGVTVIVISNNGYKELYAPLFDSTGGLFINIYSNFAETLTDVVDLVSEEVTDGVWIRLSDGTTIKLDKEPEEGDLVTDSNGDGYPDSLQLIFPPTHTEFDTIDGEKIELAVYEFTSNPMKLDTDGDGYRDEIDKEPLIPYEETTLLLHGLNSNVGSVYGAYNKLHEQNDADPINDTKTPNPEIFGDIANQEVQFNTKGRLYDKMKQKGFDSVRVYNYANQAYIISRTCEEAGSLAVSCWNKADNELWQTGSDTDFKAYLNNLISSGNIEAPTDYHKPVVNIVAHSMGGLVSRIMYELDENPPVYLNNLITWATPHFGTFHDLAGWGSDVGNNALSNLDRDSHLYDKLNARSQARSLEPKRQFVVNTDHPADIRPATEYHFMMGARLKNKLFKSSENTPSFILTEEGCPIDSNTDCHIISFPQPGTKDERDAFKELVEQNLNSYPNGKNFKVLDTDNWLTLTLNSGLGYSGKMKVFEDNLGDQLLSGTRTIYVGRDADVGHSPIHGNKDVINRTVDLLAR